MDAVAIAERGDGFGPSCRPAAKPANGNLRVFGSATHAGATQGGATHGDSTQARTNLRHHSHLHRGGRSQGEGPPAHGAGQVQARHAADPRPIHHRDFGGIAGIEQAQNDFAQYGQGAQGYGKRFGAAFADQATSNFFGIFAYPSIFHQDPRYFRKGKGSFGSRLGYAFSRPLVTRSDAGNSVFNYSNVLAHFTASGISNAYYPDNERGAGLTFGRAAIGVGVDAGGFLLSEFGPDIVNAVFHRKKTKP